MSRVWILLKLGPFVISLLDTIDELRRNSRIRERVYCLAVGTFRKNNREDSKQGRVPHEMWSGQRMRMAKVAAQSNNVLTLDNFPILP